MLESDGVSFLFVIRAWCSSVVRPIKLNSFPIDGDLAITTLLSGKKNINSFFFLGSKGFDAVAFLE